LGELEEMAERYAGRVAFFVVYIKEAHPEDGWVLASNRAEGIAVRDPTSASERSACAVRMHIRMPVLIDALDNETARQYGGWPDRLYLIGKDGRIAFQGETGPDGFRPEELERAIHAELAAE
jgi:iodothyronine deiodinase-like protein